MFMILLSNDSDYILSHHLPVLVIPLNFFTSNHPLHPVNSPDPPLEIVSFPSRGTARFPPGPGAPLVVPRSVPSAPRSLSAPVQLDGFCRADLGLVLDKSDLPLAVEELIHWLAHARRNSLLYIWRNKTVLIWLVVWKHDFYDFPYIGNNHPNWRAYFSEGLKPETRYKCGAFLTKSFSAESS